jgi:hypothetical protein
MIFLEERISISLKLPTGTAKNCGIIRELWVRSEKQPHCRVLNL